MKLKQTEAQTMSQIKEYLEYEKWTVYRINNMGVYNPKSKGYYFQGRKGVSDLIATKDQTILFIECKSSTGVASPEQKAFLKSVNGYKHVIGVCAKDIKDVIRKLK